MAFQTSYRISQPAPPETVESSPWDVASEAEPMGWIYNASDEISSDPCDQSDPVTDNTQQQDSLHTVDIEPLSQNFAERVSLGTVGMGACLIDPEHHDDIPDFDLSGCITDNFSQEDGNYLSPTSNCHLDPRISGGSHQLTAQDMAPLTTAAMLRAAAEIPYRLHDSTSPSNGISPKEKFDSRLAFGQTSSYHAGINNPGPPRSDLAWAGVLSETPWIPYAPSVSIPQVQVEVPQSPSIGPLHQPISSQHLGLIPTVGWRMGWPIQEHRQLPDLQDNGAGRSRRSSFLSAPGDLGGFQDDTPSPTPSEASLTPSTYPDPLYCLIGECQARFTGRWRRSNQLRHKRLLHNTVKYTCGAPNCNKTFNRQDARLKHHRKHHTEEFPDLKPPSKRKYRELSDEYPYSQDDIAVSYHLG